MRCYAKDELVTTIAGFDEDEARCIVRQMLERGVAPSTIMSACSEAMAIIGGRFRSTPGSIAEVTMAEGIVDSILTEIESRPNQGCRGGELMCEATGTIDDGASDWLMSQVLLSVQGIDSAREILAALEDAGLRDRVSLICGS